MRKTIGVINPHQNLSSETLFHFTDSFDILNLILTNGFQVRYIYEKMPKIKVGYLVNTVCFCDIPLGAVKYHLNWYGNYGIGLNRPYAKDMGISPVHYIHSKSPHIVFSSSYENLGKLKLSKITPYLKQVKGKQLFYNEETQLPYWKWKKFYEEREWRYLSKNPDVEIIKYKSEIELDAERVKLNNTKILEYIPLDLDPIEYIILSTRKEIKPFVQILRTSKKYKPNEIDTLISKIITAEQIIKDF